MSLAVVLTIFVVATAAVGLLREIAIKEPYWRREVVEAKVKVLFPNYAPAHILQLLDTVVPSFWGPERLQLALLKLSKGDVEQLRRYVGTPKRDFMNLIGRAEYPKASRIGMLNCAELPGFVQGLINDSDLRQYLTWLKKR